MSKINRDLDIILVTRDLDLLLVARDLDLLLVARDLLFVVHRDLEGQVVIQVGHDEPRHEAVLEVRDADLCGAGQGLLYLQHAPRGRGVAEYRRELELVANVVGVEVGQPEVGPGVFHG